MTAPAPNLRRFLRAQEDDYHTALHELKAGYKTSHWMWYIFPQYKGLGSSVTSEFYAIQSVSEARAYLAHEVLSARLRACSEVVLALNGKTAEQIFGHTDAMKLRSSMTMFSAISSGPDNVFQQVLIKYYAGKADRKTLLLMTGKRL